jgi:hypothetical protein
MARAAKLNSQEDPEMFGNLAAYDVGLGRIAKAMNEPQAAGLAPSGENQLATSGGLMFAGRYREAIEAFDRIANNNPDAARGDAPSAFWAHLLLNGEDDALQFAAQRDMPELANMVHAFKAEAGLSSMTAPQLKNWASRRFGDGGRFELANYAALAGYYGHAKLGLALLRLTFDRVGGYGLQMLWHPALAEARKTAEFRQLVSDLGLPKVWRESGDWGDYCRPRSATEITCS